MCMGVRISILPQGTILTSSPSYLAIAPKAIKVTPAI
jgi:hypothetical protein